MDIRSDTITLGHLFAAKREVGTEVTEVSMDVPRSWKPRTHAFGHAIRLTGYGPHHTRYVNLGTAPRSGWSHEDNGTDRAATWMDWGWLIAALYRFDPAARIGSYADRDDFLRQTADYWPRRLTFDKSARNFAARHAAWCADANVATHLTDSGPHVNGPFVLLDRVIPVTHLVNLSNPATVQSWLAS